MIVVDIVEETIKVETIEEIVTMIETEIVITEKNKKVKAKAEAEARATRRKRNHQERNPIKAIDLRNLTYKHISLNFEKIIFF